ncbi:kdel lys-asp-glu-leu containing - related [Holotrichia oblita]|uniref:Kdel lys-asp-glu-leu containing - related n=1 Tax=Holotrichia oblita TaxID=644536 RepID=A0ACB9TEU0_HOLOL|nr:kdel lys-asp-glu-leu containing - related [Holotrichia oblita]
MFACLKLIANSNDNDDKYINIWGPGLSPQEIVMPARYFFIELKKYNRNQTNNELKVILQGSKDGRACRIRTNLLKRIDGIYIFRYKLYESCDSLQINVMYNDIHIGKSPYKYGSVFSDECNCPIDMNSWQNKWQCPIVPERILKDLKEFIEIDWNNLREQIINAFDKPGSISLCHYIIKSNLVYRRCYGKYTGFKMFIDNILLSLSRKVILPDTEFFVNLGDWPLSSEAVKYPILSWCGSMDSFDIVMPTYDLTESTLENLGRVTLDMLSVQGNVNKQWKDRKPKAFWRGRDSNKERLKLIDISRQHPDLYNVSLTNFFFFRDKEKEYGPKADHVSLFSFFDYKYQINIDGTVAAYRLPYLLGGGSLVFKQDSSYYEHFYDDLTPNVHYIPIRRDLSDLTEKIKWAIINDKDAYKIAVQGQIFAINQLLPKDIFCYYVHLINELNKKIISPIIVFDDMELVELDTVVHCACRLKDEL